MALGSTIYDVCNDVIVHGLLKRYLGSERAAAMQHCSELEALGLFQDAVIIFDRGYYSEDMFRYFSSKGYLCVMRIRERLKISKKCTGDCILTLPRNKKKGTPATSTSIEQEFYINLLLSDLSALVKCAADQKIESHKKEKNRYRYQANRAYIIGRRKMFIARFLARYTTLVPDTNVLMRMNIKHQKKNYEQCIQILSRAWEISAMRSSAFSRPHETLISPAGMPASISCSSVICL